ncbi:hypothetical protein [Modestobacter versicolor]|uniref:hypothetical protein n=1 Tax=Modestobacter versicolor TaxID=429133 RepID=UPI0034DFEC78
MAEPFERQQTEVFPEGALPAGSSAAGVPAEEETTRRREVAPGSLVVGLLFVLLAVLLMTGVDVPADWFGHGVSWVLLIGAGIALLVNELRRSRRKR